MKVVAFTRQRPRTCVACREESPKGVLIRIARSPAGEVFLDERGKLPGRGAYLCVRRECLDKARKTRALVRALKTEIPEELYTRLGEYIESYWKNFPAAEALLQPGEARPAAPRLTEPRFTELRSKELIALLGLSRRAGLVHIGMDSVKSQCAKLTEGAKTKKPLLILTASDCSEPVKDFARRQTGNGEVLWLGVPLSIGEISAALGANNVQMIALPVRSGLTDRIKALLFESCERSDGANEVKGIKEAEKTKEAKKGRRISLPEGGVALEQNESV